MMRSDQINQHKHGSSVEKIPLSSNINIIEKKKSKEIKVHETLSKNKSKDISES